MFRSYFHASTHMLGYQFAGILGSAAVHVRVFAFILQQVITYTASDETVLYARQSIYRMIDVEQWTVVCIQVRAYFGMDARWALAAPAFSLVPSLHGIHIGAGTAQVAQISFEVGHPGDGFHLAEDTILASADDEFPLVGGDGAEGTSTETSAVDIDRELNHVVSRNTFSLVFGMRQTGIRQIERVIQFALRHGRVGRIDYYRPVACILKDARCLVFV